MTSKELAVIGKHETATAAAAEAQKALIESAYTIGQKFPRDEDKARQKILAACKRPAFAESALYAKPVGKECINGRWVDKYAVGLSIRAAEESMRLWGNMRTTVQAIYDDNEKRIISITVIDLQTNAMHNQDVTIMKVIEKKYPKDGVVVSERLNSKSEKVYSVLATADEIDKKQGIAISKIVRNHVLRLLPAELKEEMSEAIEATKHGIINANPAKARKKMIDAFFDLGINVDCIKKIVNGQDLDTLSTSQVADLKNIYSAIRDGQANIQDYLGKEEPEDKKKATLKAAKKQPLKGELKAGGDTINNATQQELGDK